MLVNTVFIIRRETSSETQKKGDNTKKKIKNPILIKKLLGTIISMHINIPSQSKITVHTNEPLDLRSVGNRHPTTTPYT